MKRLSIFSIAVLTLVALSVAQASELAANQVMEEIVVTAKYPEPFLMAEIVFTVPAIEDVVVSVKRPELEAPEATVADTSVESLVMEEIVGTAMSERQRIAGRRPLMAVHRPRRFL